MASLSTPICAKCGHDRITYKESLKTHICLPFALPADSPLDDKSIDKFAALFAEQVKRSLRAIRKEGGGKTSRIISLS